MAQRASAPSRARLAGTPGYVRSMAVPRLEEIAQRLQLARHEAVAEDLLDAALPVARLTFRPWRGPWTEKLSPPASALELAVTSPHSEQIAVRVWLDVEASEPTEEIRVPPSKLGAGWLEGVVLEFVQRALARG
jgi:hypothetical protein